MAAVAVDQLAGGHGDLAGALRLRLIHLEVVHVFLGGLDRRVGVLDEGGHTLDRGLDDGLEVLATGVQQGSGRHQRDAHEGDSVGDLDGTHGGAGLAALDRVVVGEADDGVDLAADERSLLGVADVLDRQVGLGQGGRGHGQLEGVPGLTLAAWSADGLALEVRGSLDRRALRDDEAGRVGLVVAAHDDEVGAVGGGHHRLVGASDDELLMAALEGVEETVLRPVVVQRHVRGVCPVILSHVEGGELDVRRVGQADCQCASGR